MNNLTYFYVAFKAHHEQHEFYLSAFRTSFIATHPPLPSHQQSFVYKDGGFRNGTLLADLQARFFLNMCWEDKSNNASPSAGRNEFIAVSR